MNENIEKEIEKEKKQSANVYLKWIGAIVSPILIIVLGIIAYYKENFPTVWIVVGVICFVIFGILMWFGGSIYNYIKEKKKEIKDKIPPAKSVKEMIPICQDLVVNPQFADMIPYTNKHVIHTIGKKNTKIFEYRGIGIHTGSEYVILANMHYPELNTVLINPQVVIIKNAVNNLAFEPEEPADEKETVAESALTGTKVTTKEKIHKKLEQEKKEESDVK